MNAFKAMRKKLDTRFPASRIKKIMQTDEDVGKIALAVPLLVSKALELFLQDLCDRTYNVTLKRGAKTMSSSHLKQCVHNFSVFDFLKETVSRVPDVGFSNVGGEDRSSKRRKAVDDEGSVTDEELNRSKRGLVHTGRLRGRGRCMVRRRVSHGTEWDVSRRRFECEDGPGTHLRHYDKPEQDENELSRPESKENGTNGAGLPARDFDLNLDLDENGFATKTHALPSPAAASTVMVHEMKQEEHDGWPPPTCIGKMTMDPLQLAIMDGRIEEEDDYDDEG